MQTLPTHEEHHDLGAEFAELNGAEVVQHYGDRTAELAHLQDTVAALDFSFRTRLVVVGGDRSRFLHSQCTNDIARLKSGEGCYTAITSNKGRVQGDANVFVLADEILLDAEPGQAEALTKRFTGFVVSDDVEIVDAAPHYGLLTVQGPRAAEVIAALELGAESPAQPFASATISHPVLGELYVANCPRLRTNGFDLFVPVASLGVLLDKLITAAKALGGGLAGWEAFNDARVAAGIPRFGVDMTEANLAPEAGLDTRAISYQKGCYIGQEILNRLRTFAEVSKKLCRLRTVGEPGAAPRPGDKLMRDDKEAGHLTSVAELPDGHVVALGYLRKQWLGPGEAFTTVSGRRLESGGPVG